ncbi:hypothetical protein Ddye_002529 [Dipteronia dyeriana]|uniref:Uncharacterized protein n=1 Tax=Dipteronia dyeriana TaxID=168575 RepID=A0AAE0CUG7_9ROSI|nr:hypothetical protein Ddye_002529 [Dipteronia dyeriana]
MHGQRGREYGFSAVYGLHHVEARGVGVWLISSASKQLGGYGIRVNSVSPGAVATPMLCEQMGMEAEEVERTFQSSYYLNGVLKVKHVANAVVFLASGESDFITGHNLVLDGAYKQL